MARKYRVDRHALGWAVFDETGAAVSAVCRGRDIALTQRDRLQCEADRRAQSRQRPCMCCGASFLSEGVQNRLCGGCRVRGLDLQMVG